MFIQNEKTLRIYIATSIMEKYIYESMKRAQVHAQKHIYI